MELKKPLQNKAEEFILELLRDAVRSRQYKSGKAVEDGAREILDKDVTLWDFIKSHFTTLRVTPGSMILSTPLEHRKVFDADAVAHKYQWHIKTVGHERTYDMGNAHIRYSEDLTPEVMWENKNFFHGHFNSKGGEWRKFRDVCLAGNYKDPRDTALSFGISSALLSTLSYLKYSRYGSYIVGCEDQEK